MALKAIDVTADESEHGTPVIYWQLTNAGRRLMFEAGVHRAEQK
jgi:hypothetical protein